MQCCLEGENMFEKLEALQFGNLAKESHNAYVDGFGTVENPERPAHHKDEHDDVGLVHKSFEKRRKHLHL